MPIYNPWPRPIRPRLALASGLLLLGCASPALAAGGRAEVAIPTQSQPADRPRQPILQASSGPAAPAQLTQHAMPDANDRETTDRHLLWLMTAVGVFGIVAVGVSWFVPPAHFRRTREIDE